MSNDGITTLPRVDNHFGGCPTCHKTDGFLNIGRDHWFVCHHHRTKWCVGSQRLARAGRTALAGQPIQTRRLPRGQTLVL